MNSIDLYIQKYFSSVQTQGLTELMYIISNIFDISIYSAIIFACFIWLIYLIRGEKYAKFFAFIIIFTGIFVYVLKVLFNTARPLDGVITAFGASFPSYHATISAVFFITIFYTFNPVFGSSFLSGMIKKVSLFVCVILVLLVSVSRIYLGVHWFSDVFFGVLLGAGIFYLSRFIFQRLKWL